MTGIPGKTGVVDTLDRETGEFLWANPTVAQNVITHIDGATGDVTENPEVIFSALGQERLACPSCAGSKDWEAVRLAFEFLVLTAAPVGARSVGHNRRDGHTGPRVVIPATRMKANREHRVPLRRRAVELLDAARALGDGGRPLVFTVGDREPLDERCFGGFWSGLGSRPPRMAPPVVPRLGGGGDGAPARVTVRWAHEARLRQARNLAPGGPGTAGASVAGGKD